MNIEKKPTIKDYEKTTNTQIQSNKAVADNIQVNNSKNDTIQISNIYDQLVHHKPKNIQEKLINYENNLTKLQQLRSYLNKWLRIEISDCRIFVGMFLCTDRDLNLILGYTGEYINENDMKPRMLGLIMIPGVHIKSIAIEANVTQSCSIPQPIFLNDEPIQNEINGTFYK